MNAEQLLGSLVVSAVTSALVAGVILLINGWRDRVLTQRLKAFDVAVTMAKEKTTALLKQADIDGSLIAYPDLVMTAAS